MKKSKYLLKYLVITLFTLLFCNFFDGALSFSVFVGAIYSANPFLSALIFLSCNFLFGWERFVVALSKAVVMLLGVLLFKLLKRKIPKFALCLMLTLSGVVYLLWNTHDTVALLDKLVFFATSVFFAFVCICCFNCVFVRGLRYKPAIDELGCLCLFMVAFFYATCLVPIFDFSLIEFLAPFAILFSMCAISSFCACVVAVCLGIASVFCFGDFLFFFSFVVFAMGAIATNNLNRYVAGLSVVGCDVLIKVFFGSLSLNFATLVPVLVSVGLFLICPQKSLVFLNEKLGYAKQNYSSASVVNRLKTSLSKQLFDLSNVFFSMQSTFRNIANSAIPPEQAKTILAKSVCDKICHDCSKRSECWRLSAQKTHKTFDDLVCVALSRGKASILDVDSYLSAKCVKLNGLLSETNNEVRNYLSYYTKTSQIDTSRLLFCDQLFGVSKIMQSLAQDCKNKMVFNSEKEKILVEELTYYNILTKEAVFLEDERNLLVVLTVDKKDYDANAVCSIVSSITNCQMIVEKVEPCTGDNWVIVHLVPQPQFEIAFGVAHTPKSGNDVSGDTYSFSKISKDKFLLSVCDGMGSGENAEKVSNTTMSLIENFYKAGFDNDVILTSVNKLLSVVNGESFTAVDVCVINLQKGLCDFIKLGATWSICKISSKVQFVSGSSLPLGVLEEIKPTVTKTVLSHGDMVVLFSDGFADCFDDKNVLGDYMQNNVLTNPQIIADELLSIALKRSNGNAKDDVTVLVARVI